MNKTFNTIKVFSVGDFINKSNTCLTIDIRNKNDYSKGHIPGSINLPFTFNLKVSNLDSIVRNIDNGFLSGLFPNETIDEINKLNTDKPNLIYCSTGKIHSPIFAYLLKKIGLKSFILKQGYRAYKDFVKKSFQKPVNLILVTGKTGCGKTAVLMHLEKLGEQVIDLERLAIHTGSVFGGLHKGKQPTHDQFQNNLCQLWNNLDFKGVVWMEDEAKHIGSVGLPDTLWEQMQKAPRIVLDIPKSKRIRNIIKEYGIVDNSKIMTALISIKKRFGEKNTQDAIKLLELGNIVKTVEILLLYYDNAYECRFGKSRKDRCVTIVSTNQSPDCIAQKVLMISKNISNF